MRHERHIKNCPLLYIGNDPNRQYTVKEMVCAVELCSCVAKCTPEKMLEEPLRDMIPWPPTSIAYVVHCCALLCTKVHEKQQPCFNDSRDINEQIMVLIGIWTKFTYCTSKIY